jgi:hypothetical protein
LPAVALITAAGIMQIPIKKIKNFLIAAIVVFGIFQLIFISYPISNNRLTKKISLPIYLPEKIGRYKFFPQDITLLNLGQWSISGRGYSSYPIDARAYLTADEEIFKIIDSSRGVKENISVFIIPDNTQLWYLQYKTYITKRPFRIFCDYNQLWWQIKSNERALIQDLILNSDYIIDKDGGNLGEFNVLGLIAKARNNFNKNKDKFILVNKVSWPDGSDILIFKRKDLPQLRRNEI